MNKTESIIAQFNEPVHQSLEHQALHNAARNIETVAISNIKNFDDPDEYVYHITTKPVAAKIMQQGFKPNQPALMTNYANYSKGKIFFTEKPGINYWLEKVEQHAFNNFDDPPPVMLLRVPKIAIQSHLHPDNIGTKDSRAKCYYITTPFK